MSTPRHWFISDTHFCAHRSEHIEAFERLCTLPKSGDKMLLLGDIFEIWVDDELPTASDLKIEAILNSCIDKGVEVYFMHGNRDFMVGQSFQQRTGVNIMSDPSIWTLPNGRKTILTHGDWFCTDDASYRKYRRIVRNKIFQFGFRLLPQKTKINIAHKIRQRSLKAHEANQYQSYDANQELIAEYYKKFAPIDTIIMGHTHLPDLHLNNNQIRLVLGDWRATLWYGVASADEGFKLFEAELDLSESKLVQQFK